MNPSASVLEIQTAERKIGLTFPDSIRQYYRFNNGTVSATDTLIWDFFDLSLVENLHQLRNESYNLSTETEIIPGNLLFTFCDVLLDAPTYVVSGDPTRYDFGSFYGDDGSEGWLVASSFESFVDIFAESSEDVLLFAKE